MCICIHIYIYIYLLTHQKHAHIVVLFFLLFRANVCVHVFSQRLFETFILRLCYGLPERFFCVVNLFNPQTETKGWKTQKQNLDICHGVR